MTLHDLVRPAALTSTELFTLGGHDVTAADWPPPVPCRPCSAVAAAGRGAGRQSPVTARGGGCAAPPLRL